MIAAAATPFSYRQVKIGPPLADEAPQPADDGLDVVRVARWQGRVVGGYRLTRVAPLRFGIAALVVCEGFRGWGVGRWLLGHAIGVAESKGARIIDAPCSATGLFRAVGFEAGERGLQLQLAPE